MDKCLDLSKGLCSQEGGSRPSDDGQLLATGAIGPEYDDGLPKHYRWLPSGTPEQHAYVWVPGQGKTIKGVVFLQHGYEGHTRASFLLKKYGMRHKEFVEKSRGDIHELHTKLLEHKEFDIDLTTPKGIPTPYHERSYAPEGFPSSDNYSDASHYTYKESIIELLNSDKYLVVGVDLPGHGLSALHSKPKGIFDMEHYCRNLPNFLKAILDEFGIEARSIPIMLLGSSLGGNIVFNAAMTQENALENIGVKSVFLLGSMFSISQLSSGLMRMVKPIISGFGFMFPDITLPITSKHHYPWTMDTMKLDPLIYHDVPMTLGFLRFLCRAVNDAPHLISPSEHSIKFIFLHNATDDMCCYEGVVNIHNRLRSNGYESSLHTLNCERIFHDQEPIPPSIKGLSAKHNLSLKIISKPIWDMLPDYFNTVPHKATVGLDVDHTLLNEPDSAHVASFLMLPIIRDYL